MKDEYDFSRAQRGKFVDTILVGDDPHRKRMKPNLTVWTTGDGTQMRIADMTLSHLNHCIAKVLRESPWRCEYTEPLLNELARRKERGEA